MPCLILSLLSVIQDPVPPLLITEMAIRARKLLLLHYQAHDTSTRTQTQMNACNVNSQALTCCHATFISNALELCEAEINRS